MINYLKMFGTLTASSILMSTLSDFLNRTFAEYFYLLTLFISFMSFWYGSLKYFKQSVETARLHRLVFRLLTIITWNLSYYSVLSGHSKNLLQIAADFVLNFIAIVFFWLTFSYVKSIRFAVIFDQSTPSFLNSTGPYKYVRHPFYASYVLVYLSVIITQSFWPLQLLSSSLIIYYYFAAKHEEDRFLQSHLSSEYSEYKSKTRMFFPRVF